MYRHVKCKIIPTKIILRMINLNNYFYFILIIISLLYFKSFNFKNIKMYFQALGFQDL